MVQPSVPRWAAHVQPSEKSRGRRSKLQTNKFQEGPDVFASLPLLFLSLHIAAPPLVKTLLGAKQTAENKSPRIFVFNNI